MRDEICGSAMWRRAAALLAAALLAGCSNSNQHEELITELKGIRQELATLRQEMVRPAQARNAAPADQVQVKSVAFGDGPRLGRGDARVALVEFSDFQCPFCARYHSTTYERLKSSYVDTGKVAYVFRNLPLGGHAEAKPAALAAHCAEQQGAFWAMGRQLFTNQSQLGPKFYLESARRLQLKESDFSRCLSRAEPLQKIEQDAQYGSSIGVTGTPSFFVGRVEGDSIVDVKRLVGAQPYEAFASLLDQYLAAGGSPRN